MFGRNNQPSDNGTTRNKWTLTQLEEALHFALKREQKVWGSGSEHEAAHAEVERLTEEINSLSPRA